MSVYLKQETQRLLGIDRHIDVIHNFYLPREAQRSREDVRRELGIGDEAMILHCSNLRPVKRIDLLLETAARIRPRDGFKLVILAGEAFAPFAEEVRRLELEDRVIVREKVDEIEEYLQAADLGLITSDMESFCLTILEGMFFGCPSVATRVGGIPEVVEEDVTGVLVGSGDSGGSTRAVEGLIGDPKRREALGRAGQEQARARFSAEVIVPRYEELYRRVLGEERQAEAWANRALVSPTRKRGFGRDPRWRVGLTALGQQITSRSVLLHTFRTPLPIFEAALPAFEFPAGILRFGSPGRRTS